MKILILSNFANGLILFRKEVITSFIDNGNEVIISVPLDEHCAKLESLGAHIIPCHLERRGMNPIKDFKLFSEYLRLIKTQKPDVILTYTIKPNLYGGLAARLQKIPYLMNVTGLGTALENPGILGKILILFYKIATQKAFRVFFQNSENMNFMHQKGIAQQNSILLPGSGINVKEHPFTEYPSEENGIQILAVLRIMKDKGVEEYFDAAKSISAKYPHVSFHLVGAYEEDSRQKYEPIIQELQKQGILKYYGHIDNVPDVMAQSHIIVHPSYHEGLSNVCLEAAACGRPVLTTDVPGCRDTIISAPPKNDEHGNSTFVSHDSTSGILFSSKSSQALIATLETVLSYTPEQRAQMGINGRRYVEQYFNRQLVIDVYQSAVSDIKKVQSR